MFTKQFIWSRRLLCRLLMSKWKDTNKKEIQKFFKIAAIIKVNSLPRFYMYWSKDKKYRNLRIAEFMTREQFEMLLNYLHFFKNYDNSTGRIFKIEKVLNLTIQQFKQTVTPGEGVVINENMMPWRERLSFCQYVTEKVHKYGVQI